MDLTILVLGLGTVGDVSIVSMDFAGVPTRSHKLKADRFAF